MSCVFLCGAVRKMPKSVDEKCLDLFELFFEPDRCDDEKCTFIPL